MTVYPIVYCGQGADVSDPSGLHKSKCHQVSVAPGTLFK